MFKRRTEQQPISNNQRVELEHPQAYHPDILPKEIEDREGIPEEVIGFTSYEVSDVDGGFEGGEIEVTGERFFSIKYKVDSSMEGFQWLEDAKLESYCFNMDISESTAKELFGMTDPETQGIEESVQKAGLNLVRTVMTSEDISKVFTMHGWAGDSDSLRIGPMIPQLMNSADNQVVISTDLYGNGHSQVTEQGIIDRNTRLNYVEHEKKFGAKPEEIIQKDELIPGSIGHAADTFDQFYYEALGASGDVTFIPHSMGTEVVDYLVNEKWFPDKDSEQAKENRFKNTIPEARQVKVLELTGAINDEHLDSYSKVHKALRRLILLKTIGGNARDAYRGEGDYDSVEAAPLNSIKKGGADFLKIAEKLTPNIVNGITKFLIQKLAANNVPKEYQKAFVEKHAELFASDPAGVLYGMYQWTLPSKRRALPEGLQWTAIIGMEDNLTPAKQNIEVRQIDDLLGSNVLDDPEDLDLLAGVAINGMRVVRLPKGDHAALVDPTTVNEVIIPEFLGLKEPTDAYSDQDSLEIAKDDYKLISRITRGKLSSDAERGLAFGKVLELKDLGLLSEDKARELTFQILDYSPSDVKRMEKPIGFDSPEVRNEKTIVEWINKGAVENLARLGDLKLWELHSASQIDPDLLAEVFRRKESMSKMDKQKLDAVVSLN